LQSAILPFVSSREVALVRDSMDSAAADAIRRRIERLKVEPQFCLAGEKIVRICETLGSGTTGRVVRAEWLGLTVAVKVLRPLNEIADPQTRAHAASDFANEIAINACLGWHPNIVAFLATARDADATNKAKGSELLNESCNGRGSMGSSIGIAFEMVRGGRLDPSRLGVPKLTRVLEIALDIARALVHAHRLGIMHRDVKPSNVMMTEAGNCGAAKLCDWGLATEVAAVGKDRETGSNCFMAPEIFLGADYGSAADVFSFGILLQTLCAGLPNPYADRYLTPDQAVSAVAHRGLRPTIPSVLVDSRLACLMTQCWSLSPNDRPGMLDVAVILLEILDERKLKESTVQKPPTLAEWFSGWQ
jgi:serine/threonine protein kinase